MPNCPKTSPYQPHLGAIILTGQIAFNQDSVHHVYFVAETKGSAHAIDLREREKQKIASAGAFFDKLGQSQTDETVDKQPMPITYAVVSNFEQLMQMVGKPSAKLMS